MIENLLIVLIVIISIAILFFAINSILTLAHNTREKNDDSTMLHNHSLPVLIIQKGGKIKYWNNELKELIGFSEGTRIDLNKMAKKAKGGEPLFKVFNDPGTYEFEIEDQLVAVNSFDAQNGMIVVFLGKESGYHKQNLESSQQNIELDSQTNKKSAELSELAKFGLEFVRILEKHADYVVISGYVSILLGRARATEDIDVFMERISKEKFSEFYAELKEKGFWCINAEKWDEVFLNADIAEGDLSRLILRTADNLQHIANLSDHFPEIAATARQAKEIIMRTPVITHFNK